MKTKIIFLYLTLIISNSFAQFEEPVIIDDSVDSSIRNIITIDIDNDNLKDIVVSHYFNKITWYKNNGGSFSQAQSISTNIPAPYHLDKADVNSDGFMDILVTNNNDNNSGSFVLINNNGGASWTEIELDNTLELGAFKSFFVDVEQDGDMDVVCNGDTKIVMYNNDGNGNFSAPITIESLNEYYSMAVGDYTNDSFIDLMVNSATSGTILFANNTTGGFSEPVSLIDGLSISLCTEDIDKDGDLDLFRGDPNGALGIQYFNNNEGNFSFTYNLEELNPNDVTSAEFHLNDLNNDAYPELLFIQADAIHWRINQQDGTFSNSELIDETFAYRNIYADDMDIDGDRDIIWFGWDLNSDTGTFKLGLLNNNTSLGLNEKLQVETIKISPNPANSYIAVSSVSNINKVQVFNIQGQEVLTTDRTTIDISKLENGIYFLKLHMTNTKFTNHLFIKD